MNDVQRAGARRGWLLGLILAIGLIAPGRAQAADILLVGGQLDSSDIEMVTLLKGFGHTILNEGSYTTPGNQFFTGIPTAAQLANVDLILFSRTAVSTEYDDAGEPAAWNTLAKPLLLLNSAIVRGGSATLADNRWGWMNATAVVSGALNPTDFDPYPNPSHPFVNGRTTSAFPSFQTMDYINSMDVVPGSTMVATLTVAGVNTPGILDIPAGTTLFADAQGTTSVTGGRRVFFQMYEYPDTTDVFALSTNGGQILNQIINVMTSNAPSIRAGDVDGDGDVDLTDFNAIKENFLTTVTTRAQGDLNGDGFVDLGDFRIWKENDPLAGVGATIGVPEPASAVTALVGALGLAALRRKRRTARSPQADDGAAEVPATTTSTARRGVRLVPLSLAAAALAAVAGQPAAALNIAWVSFHAGDDTPSTAAANLGFTQAPDVGYTQLLASSGHTVTRFVTVDNIDSAANQPLRDSLNSPTIDIVIVSRSVDSAHYQSAAEGNAWNVTIDKPLMLMSGYVARNSRLGYVGGEVIEPDTTGPVKLTAAVPGHAVFQGIALDGTNTMVNDYSPGLVVVNNGVVNNVTQRGISVNELPIDAAGSGGTLIASTSASAAPANRLVIAEWAEGTTITKDTGPITLGNHRMVFLSGSREQATGGSSQMAGIFDLTADGTQMFTNAVNYLGNFAPKPGDVNLDGVVNLTDFNAIRDNFQKTVASRAMGDLTDDGFVDWKDYRQWKDFREAGVPAGSLVPEPAAGLLAVTALVALARRRRTAA